MGQSRPCPACQESRSDPLGHVQGFEIRSCSRCKTVFTGQLPGSDESTTYYASFYAEGRDIAVPDFVLDRLRGLVRGLDGYRKMGTWLDIGCGSGTLLRAAGSEGWEAIGTE